MAVEEKTIGIGEEIPNLGITFPVGSTRCCPDSGGEKHVSQAVDMFCRRTKAHLPSGESARAVPCPKRTADAPLVSRVNTA